MNFLNSFFTGIDNMIVSIIRVMEGGGSPATLITIFLILGGVIIGTFGYKIFKMIIAINSAVIFGLVAWTVLSMNGFNTELINALTALAAIGGAFAGFFLYQIGLFLQGFFTTFLLSIFAVTAMEIPMNFTIVLIVLALSITGGVLAIVLKKWFIILSSSFNGAFFTVAGIQFAIILSAEGNRTLIRRLTSDLSWLVSEDFLLILTIPFAIGFCVVQYLLEKKNPVFKVTEQKKEFTIYENTLSEKAEG